MMPEDRPEELNQLRDSTQSEFVENHRQSSSPDRSGLKLLAELRSTRNSLVFARGMIPPRSPLSQPVFEESL